MANEVGGKMKREHAMKNSSETVSSVRRNVREICKIEEAALRSRSPLERCADRIVRQAGRTWFILLHLCWFATWLILNSGSLFSLRTYYPFPFPLLTMVVSLESIFLSLFILMNQNRESRQADQQAHLDLQVNLLSEHESTKALQLLKALCRHHGLNCADDAKMDDLVSMTKPADIIRELKASLPGGDSSPDIEP